MRNPDGQEREVGTGLRARRRGLNLISNRRILDLIIVGQQERFAKDQGQSLTDWSRVAICMDIVW